MAGIVWVIVVAAAVCPTSGLFTAGDYLPDACRIAAQLPPLPAGLNNDRRNLAAEELRDLEPVTRRGELAARGFGLPVATCLFRGTVVREQSFSVDWPALCQLSRQPLFCIWRN